jgi:hypothetical protein
MQHIPRFCFIFVCGFAMGWFFAEVGLKYCNICLLKINNCNITIVKIIYCNSCNILQYIAVYCKECDTPNYTKMLNNKIENLIFNLILSQ